MNVEHYKGKIYRYIDTVIPLKKLSEEEQSSIREHGIYIKAYNANSVKKEPDEIEMYEYKGKKYAFTEEISVFYYAYTTGLYWVREAQDFYSDVEVNGKVRKRFEFTTKVW